MIIINLKKVINYIDILCFLMKKHSFIVSVFHVNSTIYNYIIL